MISGEQVRKRLCSAFKPDEQIHITINYNYIRTIGSFRFWCNCISLRLQNRPSSPSKPGLSPRRLDVEYVETRHISKFSSKREHETMEQKPDLEASSWFTLMHSPFEGGKPRFFLGKLQAVRPPFAWVYSPGLQPVLRAHHVVL